MSQFVFSDYSYQATAAGLVLKFKYQLSERQNFEHQVLIKNFPGLNLETIDQSTLNQLVFNLGMVEMLSYWKTTCDPQIVIKADQLSHQQIKWWHDLLIQGMGEFFFVNQIDFTAPNFVEIISQEADKPNHQPTKKSQTKINHSNKTLIPIGGGKDSIVTLELLKKHFSLADLSCLLVNPTLASSQIAQESGLNIIEVERQFDPQLFELNRMGYFNGHVPISASIAFLSLTVGYLGDFSSIAVSNERSSNEGSAWYHNHLINHQYSKTFEFEQKLQTFPYSTPSTQYSTPKYFSFLRPLYELQIAKLFSQLASSRQLSIFRSCNRGAKTNSWCNDCPKCLFAYSILFPFLAPEIMLEIFGQDLWQKLDFYPIARQLLGVEPQKPLECVGTREENLVSFYLSCQQFISQNQTLPPLLDQINREILNQENNLAKRAEDLLTSWNDEHALEEKFLTILKSNL